MNIGMSTACFYPELTENALERMGKLGFRQCEIFVNCAREFRDYRRVFSKIMEKYGMECVSVHPFTSGNELIYFFTGYERRILDSLEEYGRYFEFLRELGGTCFTFHGARSHGYPLKPDDREIEVYKRLTDLAQAHGIALAQENVAWCRSREPDYLAELAHRVDGLKFTLDIKQAKRAGYDYADYLTVMGERLVNLHISDADETSTCLLPGEGKIDFMKLFGHLQRINYQGSAIIEVYSDCFDDDGRLKTAGEFLRKTFGVGE